MKRTRLLRFRKQDMKLFHILNGGQIHYGRQLEIIKFLTCWFGETTACKATAICIITHLLKDSFQPPILFNSTSWKKLCSKKMSGKKAYIKQNERANT